MLWHGIREELVALSIGMNCHFYSAGKFAFGFVFHHSTNSAGGFIPWVAVMMIQVSGILPAGLLFCSWFYRPLYVKLMSFLWCVWFRLRRFVLNTLFLGATCIGDATLRSMEGILMSGLQEAKYQISEADGSSFFLYCCCCCVFFFLSIMACEMNTHSNQTTLLLFFDTQGFWFGC